jgi:hypothetical protein
MIAMLAFAAITSAKQVQPLIKADLIYFKEGNPAIGKVYRDLPGRCIHYYLSGGKQEGTPNCLSGVTAPKGTLDKSHYLNLAGLTQRHAGTGSIVCQNAITMNFGCESPPGSLYYLDSINGEIKGYLLYGDLEHDGVHSLASFFWTLYDPRILTDPSKDTKEAALARRLLAVYSARFLFYAFMLNKEVPPGELIQAYDIVFYGLLSNSNDRLSRRVFLATAMLLSDSDEIDVLLRETPLLVGLDEKDKRTLDVFLVDHDRALRDVVSGVSAGQILCPTCWDMEARKQLAALVLADLATYLSNATKDESSTYDFLVKADAENLAKAYKRN